MHYTSTRNPIGTTQAIIFHIRLSPIGSLAIERFCGSSRYTRLSTNSYMFWAMPLSRNQSYKVTLICSSQPPLIMGVIRMLSLTPADIVLRIHIKKIYNTILKDSQRYSFINYYYFSCYFPP